MTAADHIGGKNVRRVPGRGRRDQRIVHPDHQRLLHAGHLPPHQAARALRRHLSVNGSTPIDLSSAGVPIYTGVQDLVNSGVTVSDLHGTNGEGYYDGYKLNTGAEGTTVKLSAINTALTDTDGSETLSVKISGAPVGSVLSDGAGHSFTVTASNGEANVTGWSLGSLTVTPPTYYNGQFNLTVTSTSTEAVGGSASSTATIPVTVVPAVYNAITATSLTTLSSVLTQRHRCRRHRGLTVVPGTTTTSRSWSTAPAV